MGRSLRLLAFLLVRCFLLLRTAVASAAPSNNNPPPPVDANFLLSVSVDLSSSEAEDDEYDDNDDLHHHLDVIPPPDDCERLSRGSRSSRHRPAAANEVCSPPLSAFGSFGASSSGAPNPDLESRASVGGRFAAAIDGGCHISAQALMCQGGGDRQAHSEGNNEDEQQQDDDEHDNDDDDDDDNDGHSSMLSNASLRRSRDRDQLVSSGGGGGSAGRRRDGGGASSGDDSVRCDPAVAARSPGRSAALSLRGGGGRGAAAILRSQAARNLLVTALVTLVFEGSIGHILEFLKIVKQTAAVDVSYLQVLRDITRSKGVAGLWDGFCPWGIVQAVFKGAVFGLAYQLALNALRPLVDAGLVPTAAALTLAGGVGGGLQGYVLSPTLLLKTRVMTNPVFRERMSVLRTTWLSVQIGYDICAAEGLLTLMKGSNVFALKRVFDWSSRYLFSDLFESLFAAWKGGGATLTVAEKSVASLLGGVFSTCVTLPLDVLVAKTQDAKKAGVKVSAIKLFLDELHDRGWSGLQKSYMQGFEARLLHVCLTTLVIKTLTPIAYKLLFPEQS